MSTIPERSPEIDNSIFTVGKYNVSGKSIINLTNRFYLDISKKFLTDQEFEIMENILLKGYSFQSVSSEFGVSKDSIRYIYKKTFFKIKSVSNLVLEINELKEKRNQLRANYILEYRQLIKRKIGDETSFIDKKISDSHFPFSRRLWNMFEKLDIHKFSDLFAIPLETFPKFRGFKGKCLQEFIQFIEFENLEEKFEGDFFFFKRKFK